MAEAVRMSRAIATSDGFDDAFPRLYTSALRLALRMLGDRAGAEDVAAEAMARTYASWHKVRNLRYLDAWVLRTTSNLALAALRVTLASDLEEVGLATD